jgi:hypothetical protein
MSAYTDNWHGFNKKEDAWDIIEEAKKELLS